MGNSLVVFSLVLLLLLDLESVSTFIFRVIIYSLYFVVSVLFIECEFVGVGFWGVCIFVRS